MTVSVLDLRGRESCVSRKTPNPIRWAALDRWCTRCGHRWDEAVPFKSIRQLDAYTKGKSCPRCDSTSPSRS